MTLVRLITTALMCLTLAACGSRSVGNKIDDQFLEPKVRSQITQSHADLASPTSNIVVVSYNGVILLTGQTPRAELKEQAERVARTVLGVKRIHNEIQILKPTSLLVRSNDTLLTTRIKTQMAADSTVPASKIKVVTENGVVFLLGIVSRQEGQAASNLVQSVNGVQKVVKAFQYTN